MERKEVRRSDAGEVQVFELTSDNQEDQDELNRRLRKPEERDRWTATPTKGAAFDETTQQLRR